MEHINVGEFVSANGLHSGRDEEFDCFILDEEQRETAQCLIDFLPQRGRRRQLGRYRDLPRTGFGVSSLDRATVFC